MLQEIGSVMCSQSNQKSLGEYFIIPICTGNSAIDIHFLYTEYTKVSVQLKPLDSLSAFEMFFDKYEFSRQTDESAKEHLKQNAEQYYSMLIDQSMISNYSTSLCKLVSAQEHFRIALFDTGFIPKLLDDLLFFEYITPQSDWGNNLFYLMNVQAVEIDENKSGCWKSIEDICIIISFGITQQIVKRDFLLPSRTSIGDVERAGLIFLAQPTGKHFNDEFIIVMPFMLMKILNKKLLPFPNDLLFPDELLLISTKDHPWRWQDFECLHGYFQRALIKALINVKNARILAIERRIGRLQEDLEKGKNIYDIKKQIEKEKLNLANENQKNWCLSDIFRGVKGDPALLQQQVKLCNLGIFTEKEKFLVKTTDVAQFNKLVLCDDHISRPLEMAIFHCADECANIDRRWAVETASNGKPFAIFMQDKYSEYDTMDSKVSGPELLRWYNRTLESVSSYDKDYDIILVFFTVRRFTGSNLSQMPKLLLIDEECINDYLSPTFSHRGLVLPPVNQDQEQVLSYPMDDIAY